MFSWWEQNIKGKNSEGRESWNSKSSKVMVRKILCDSLPLTLVFTYLSLYFSFLFSPFPFIFFSIFLASFFVTHNFSHLHFSPTFSCPHLVKSVFCHWSYNTWLFLNISRHSQTHIPIQTHTHTHTKWDIWKNASPA